MRGGVQLESALLLKMNRLVAVSSLLLSLLLPVSAVAQTLRASWPTAHYDNSRTGFNGKEFALNTSNVDKLAEVWSFPACKGAADPPAIANGVAYVSADCRVGMYTYSNTLFAVNASTGALLWRSPLGVSNSGCQGSSPPAVSDGVVYAGSCSGMSAINAVTGAKLWQNTDVGAVVDNPLYANGPAVADGMLFFTGSDGNVNALYAANGVGDWGFSSPYGIAGAPVVANGMVYVGSTAGVVYGLVEEIGVVLWTSVQTPSSGVGGPPSLANGVVYISGLFGGITALDANTGDILWNNLGSVNVAGTPALAYGMAYVAIEDEDNGPRTAYALDAKTGVIVWQVPNIGSWFSVAIANGIVYAVNDGDKNIYALDAMTGAVLAKFGDGNVNSTPVVVGGMVYFTGFDEALHAYGVGGGNNQR
jgi:outer membrane protein assembly factor BamB